MKEVTIKQCIENIKKIKGSIKLVDGIVADSAVEQLRGDMYEYGLMICDLRQERFDDFINGLIKRVRNQ